MMADGAAGNAAREASLQTEIDKITVLMDMAGTEKGAQGCNSSMGMGCSSLGVLLGLGLATCSYAAAFPGLAIALASVFGFVTSFRAYCQRAPSAERAETVIEQLGPRLEGTETLRMDKQGLRALHRLLRSASAPLTVGILRILAVVGDTDSLSMARWISALPRETYPQRSGEGPDVKREALRAAELLEQRLQAGWQRDTLLRPSETAQDSDLLRPASDPPTDPDLLLRPEED